MEMKISVMKAYVVDGKKTYRDFTFRMDPKAMAKYKTRAQLDRKLKEYILKNGPFKKEDLPDLKYDMDEFLLEWKEQIPVVAAEEMAKQTTLDALPGNRITPGRITRLAENEVFVFGSNDQGLHGGGAARFAYDNFGAVWGQGHGLQGQSYAINSMTGMADLKKDVDDFVAFAKAHPEMRFFVTPIGCGIAGLDPKDVAPLFADCKDLENVTLPSNFWHFIGAPETPAPPQTFHLERFLEAQARDYQMAYDEMVNGRKQNHWIWYIFPQQQGLGHSHNSLYYGLDGEGEARAYLDHPVLGQRLRDICKALLTHAGKRDIDYIMGSPIDVLKLQTSMNLFNHVSPNDVFKRVLEAFF